MSAAMSRSHKTNSESENSEASDGDDDYDNDESPPSDTGDSDDSNDSTNDEHDHAELDPQKEPTHHLLKLTPKFQNVASEFEDHREFVINGEALLLEMMADSNYDTSCGGQYLHFIYICERFLLQFVQKGGIVCVVFFDDMMSVWHDQPDCLLARECLRQHLMYNTSLRVISVNNPWDPLWLQYLTDKGVTFVVTTDVEYMDHVTRKKEAVYLFNIQQLLFLSQQLNLSYIGGMDASTSRILAFFSPAAVRYADLVDKTEQKLKNAWYGNITACGNLDKPGHSLLNWLRDLLKNDKLRGSNISVITGAVACSQIVHSNNSMDDVAFVKLFVLHLVLLDHMTLRYRAQCVEGEVWLSSSYTILVQIQRHMAMVLPAVISGCNVKPQSACEDGSSSQFTAVADVMDGRLLTKLLCLAHTKPHLFQESSLSRDVVNEFTQVWELIVRPELPENIAQSEAFPICDSSKPCNLIDVSEYEELTAAGSTQRTVKLKPTKLFPIDCPLVNEFVGDLYTGLDKADIKEPDIRRAIKYGKDFDERYHWHSGKPLADDYETTKETNSLNERPPQNATVWERKKWHKSKQRMADYMNWYAQSLSSVEKRQTIVVDKKASQKHRPTKGAAYKGDGDKKKLGKADMMKEANRERLEDQEREREKQRWMKYQEPFSHQKHATVLKEIDQYLEKCKVQEVRNMALLEKLQILWSIWKKQCTEDKKAAADKGNTAGEKNRAGRRSLEPAVEIMLVVQELYNKACRLSQKQVIQLINKQSDTDREAQKELSDDEREAQLISRLTVSQKQQLGQLSNKELQLIASIVGGLGFADLAVIIQEAYKEAADLPKEYQTGISSNRFQLIHMSHYLDRDLRTDPDPRAPNFIPDTWQRELLDFVDNNQSALIVAPTSSGKTYASYYCIERVLRESDDGVVVYVSPTKALVNQVAATVYGAFKKDLPSGKALHGVFTRDFRSNALNCQVLVTVPQCLEILLLSPERQKWVSRIKYVIFDEVHCLGSEIGAEVWEHLLMLIRCPFLALSATIHNPQNLRDWLQRGEDLRFAQDQKLGKLRSQNKDSYHVGLVIYRERYADLEKHIFLPGLLQENKEKTRLMRTPDKFMKLHPMYALTRDKLMSMMEFPAEMSFSARECVELYDAMSLVWPDRDGLEDMDPAQVFGSQVVIHRSAAREYEKSLKTELLQWKLDGCINKIEDVIGKLTGETIVKRKSMSNFMANSEDETSNTFVLCNIMSIVAKLKRENKLPALIFSFNRGLCEHMSNSVADILARKERQFRRLPDVRKLMKAIQDKAKYEEAKRQEDTTTKSKGSKRTAQTEENEQLSILEHDISASKTAANKAIVKYISEKTGQSTSEISITIDSSNITNALPGCSYANKGAMSEDDLDKVRFRLRYAEEIIKEGLHRGVGYHHAGLNNRVRASIELLFRKQHLQMVTATGTLALGIHMPCKSVVFAGDSPFLTSLMFRQMAGRSGRRGFDQVGNVYFFGIGPRKIQHLMSSDLSEISGNFPISTALVLRLFLFCNRSSDRQLALNMSMTLLDNPLMVMNNPVLRDQIRHFFIYCSQFLMKQGLLDEHGNPQGLAGLVTHLHYHQPANFVFVYMLKKHCFHNLCSKKNKDGSFPPEVIMTLIIVLANLFTDEYLHPVKCRNLLEKSINSKVILPSLDSELVSSDVNLLQPFKNAVTAYNKQVSANFHEYMAIAADIIEQKFSTERQLPLSKVSIGPESESISSEGLMTELRNDSTNYKVCSSFSALSGHSDDDLWNENAMIQNIRYGVYCADEVIPTFQLEKQDRKGNALIRNGYALDFYRHGSKECIIRDCGLRSSDVFEGLKDFLLTIKAITVSLATLGPEDDNVVLAFRELEQQYTKRFSSQYYSMDS